jgi:hypothetical protein
MRSGIVREASGSCALILAAAMAVIGCSEDDLSIVHATARLHDSGMYPRQSVLVLPVSVAIDDLARNPVLKARLDRLAERGLIRLVATSSVQKSVAEIVVTDAGAEHVVATADGQPGRDTTVRAATEVLDRVVSVGPLRTSQGVMVRDVQIAWHYETVTPFGEAIGLAAGAGGHTAAAAIRFGDGWRFIDQ